MNIYVGNLSFNTTEEDLQKLFSPFGEITSVNIIRDKFSGESRGFGFVEMASKDAGQQAMAGLNGTELNGRNLSVNEARPRTDAKKGGSGGGGGFRRNRGGGYRENW
jgi:RNA recognition motif-containing protein